MLIVPLPGDKIEIKSGIVSTVLSFSNYGKAGPAVFIQSLDSGKKTESIAYTSVVAINETPVTLTGGKVFSSPGAIKRKIQLPQPGDKVLANGIVISVQSLKLALRGDLSKGLVLVGENYDTKDRVVLPIREIVQIDRALGSDVFSRKAFLELYKDYLGSKSA